MPKYKQLSIDGVIGDVWDDAAVHEEDLVETVLNVLDSPTIRTALLNIYHPIGSYYFTDRNTNPGTFLGGTWEAVEGKFLIGASAQYPVNSTGGSANSSLPAHEHIVIGTIAASGNHTHTGNGSTNVAGDHQHYAASKRYNTYKGDGSYDALLQFGYNANYTLTSVAGAHAHSVSINTFASGEHTHTHSLTAASSGVDGTGKNLPPYKAAYIWVRTA